MHYAKVERDSLLVEVNLLRAEKKRLELDKNKIIENSLNKIALLETQLIEQESQKKIIDESNEKITKFWKKLSKGVKLSGFLQSDINSFGDDFYLGINLRIPLSLKFNLKATPFFVSDNKPIYLLGIEYFL